MSRGRDTQALFDAPRGRRGRVESALERAIVAARKAGALTDADAAALTLARAQARGCDLAESANQVWALAAIGRELRETLIRLRLDPVSRGGDRDTIVEFLRTLSRPEHTDPGPAVGDTPPA